MHTALLDSIGALAYVRTATLGVFIIQGGTTRRYLVYSNSKTLLQIDIAAREKEERDREGGVDEGVHSLPF